MLLSNLEILKYIKDEIDFVLSSVENKTKDDIIDTGLLNRAILRSLEIIREATKNWMMSLKSNIRILNGKKWRVQEIN